MLKHVLNLKFMLHLISITESIEDHLKNNKELNRLIA